MLHVHRSSSWEMRILSLIPSSFFLLVPLFFSSTLHVRFFLPSVQRFLPPSFLSFLSFIPSLLPTYLPPIRYHTTHGSHHTMQYHTHIPMSTNIHDLGFVLHSLLLFAHTLSIFISLSCHCHSLYTIYIYMIMNRLGVTGILSGGILQRTWEHLICLRSLC